VLVDHKISAETIAKEVPNSFYYRWEFHLKSPPEKLWPYIADTNRFDKDSGLPAYDQPEKSSVAGLTNTRRRLRIKMYGVPIEWIEEPFQWIRPYQFGIARNYEPGPIPLLQPIKHLRVLAQLNETEEGGTHLVYNVWATPRNFLGNLIIPIQIGQISARQFAKTFQRYDELASEEIPFEAVSIMTSLPTGARRRIESLQQTLVNANHSPDLVHQLLETIITADDITLSQMRPYQLAKIWQAERQDVLELMLQATRIGLLNFKWDLLCPLCRVSKESTESLADVTQTIHCDTCNIDYNANFDQSVELTFTPNPTIRKIEEQAQFCTSGPEATPHVAIQQLLNVGESRAVTPKLEPGRYRLRSPQIPGLQLVEVTQLGNKEIHFHPQAEGWLNRNLNINPEPTILFDNQLDEEQLIVMERLEWADHAVTAAEVTTLQKFRDLFAEEALRPGDQISVGSLTILFTDLCDSTRMYREIGDAPAFGLVMNHFDVLQEAVRSEGGAIVKTIGDAVMAVFLQPVAAIKAVSKAQSELMEMDSVRPLRLKAAIHYGPSIAVTLNERLDYFGSTVNIAARLEKFSLGGDIIISDSVYHDPEVQDYFNQESNPLQLEMFGSTLKGFDDECFNLHRISL
ncbi:MAG: DUF5939 domain-containing protein, partial [Chloroflexota bacterium]